MDIFTGRPKSHIHTWIYSWISISMASLLITNRKSCTGSRLAPNLMTLNDLERQNKGFHGFFGNFGLRHKSVSFTRWRHGTIVTGMRSRERIWYLYINLAWTPQFSAKLLNRNGYRLSRVSWANLRSGTAGWRGGWGAKGKLNIFFALLMVLIRYATSVSICNYLTLACADLLKLRIRGRDLDC